MLRPGLAWHRAGPTGGSWFRRLPLARIEGLSASERARLDAYLRGEIEALVDLVR